MVGFVPKVGVTVGKVTTQGSSNVLSLDYAEDTQTLAVAYRSGAQYVYLDVTPEAYAQLLGSGNRTAFIRRELLAYRKL